MFCFQAFSQDSESSANYAGLTLIPRLDLTPYYNNADGAWGFSHGNSSIYTLFEGSAGVFQLDAGQSLDQYRPFGLRR